MNIYHGIHLTKELHMDKFTPTPVFNSTPCAVCGKVHTSIEPSPPQYTCNMCHTNDAAFFTREYGVLCESCASPDSNYKCEICNEKDAFTRDMNGRHVCGYCPSNTGAPLSLQAPIVAPMTLYEAQLAGFLPSPPLRVIPNETTIQLIRFAPAGALVSNFVPRPVYTPEDLPPKKRRMQTAIVVRTVVPISDMINEVLQEMAPYDGVFVGKSAYNYLRKRISDQASVTITLMFPNLEKHDAFLENFSYDLTPTYKNTFRVNTRLSIKVGILNKDQMLLDSVIYTDLLLVKSMDDVSLISGGEVELNNIKMGKTSLTDRGYKKMKRESVIESFFFKWAMKHDKGLYIEIIPPEEFRH